MLPVIYLCKTFSITSYVKLYYSRNLRIKSLLLNLIIFLASINNLKLENGIRKLKAAHYGESSITGKQLLFTLLSICSKTDYKIQK